MKSKQKLSDPPHQRVKLKKKKIQKICNKVQMVVVCLNSYAKFLYLILKEITCCEARKYICHLIVKRLTCVFST